MVYTLSKTEGEMLDYYRNQAKWHFMKLQEMSKEAGLPVWCSASTNNEQLNNAKATYHYREYLRHEAKEDALRTLFSAYASSAKNHGKRHKEDNQHD